jgi:hypothetical protein
MMFQQGEEETINNSRLSRFTTGVNREIFGLASPNELGGGMAMKLMYNDPPPPVPLELARDVL